MKLSRKSVEPAAAVAVEPESETLSGKGRPTPKRRDVVGQRGPVTAPKTRKEAYARQKEQAKATKAATAAARRPNATMTAAERRTLLKAGDPSVLPRRDQGPTRKLARDYVDSHRMLSNYFLVLFPLMILSSIVKVLTFGVLAVAIVVIAEWYFVGRRIRRMAAERHGEAQGGNMSIGFYAGSRAYLPRRWRLPAPQVELGDTI